MLYISKAPMNKEEWSTYLVCSAVRWSLPFSLAIPFHSVNSLQASSVEYSTLFCLLSVYWFVSWKRSTLNLVGAGKELQSWKGLSNWFDIGPHCAKISEWKCPTPTTPKTPVRFSWWPFESNCLILYFSFSYWSGNRSRNHGNPMASNGERHELIR